MGDWDIVLIIVLCISIGFVVQALICYVMYYAGNRSAADNSDADVNHQSETCNNSEGGSYGSSSLSNENFNN